MPSPRKRKLKKLAALRSKATVEETTSNDIETPAQPAKAPEKVVVKTKKTTTKKSLLSKLIKSKSEEE